MPPDGGDSSAMVSHRDVDICVTCISEKPPKLPLREELVSLGVEVIYNARGTGARAVKHETRQAIKEFRKQELEKIAKKGRRFPKNGKKILQKDRERRDRERELREKLQSLSYDAYNKKLSQPESSDSSSTSSWGTNSTGATGGTGGSSIGFDRQGDRLKGTKQLEKMMLPSLNEDASLSMDQRETDNEGWPVVANLNSLHDKMASVAPALPAAGGAQCQMDITPFEEDSGSLPSVARTEDSGSDRSTIDTRQLRKALVLASGNRWWYGTHAESPPYDTSQTDKPQRVGISSKVSPVEPTPPSTDDAVRDNWLSSAVQNMSSRFSQSPCSVPGDMTTMSQGTFSTRKNPADCNPEFAFGVSSCSSAALHAQVVESNTLSTCGNTTLSKTNQKTERAAKHALFAILARESARPEEVYELLDSNPSILQCRLRYDGRLALHVACARPFPIRFTSASNVTSTLDQLIDDVTKCRELLQLVALSHLAACMEFDKKGDLPVHLLARRLMEWEAGWHEKLKSSTTGTGKGAAKITMLHIVMAECVDIVLKPVALCPTLCRRRGSVGRILPLHIGAMFGVPYDTLRLLLEVYPGAAAVPCDLTGVSTFVTNDALPLELLERQRMPGHDTSTNAKVGDNNEETVVRWSHSLDSWNSSEDFVRRSDLLFAFHPCVLPFRKEPTRIRRIEHMIRSEAERLVNLGGTRPKLFHPAIQTVWVWMCTFDDNLNEEDNYVESVKRVVNTLHVDGVKLLASMEAKDGATVLSIALPQCADTIKLRLEGKAIPNVAPSGDSVRSKQSSASGARSILKKGRVAGKSSTALDESIDVGALCKSVFNIKEVSFPTTFIILPYKLRKDENGSMSLESAELAPLARKFADCLMRLTEPWYIHHVLKKKATEHLGYKIAFDRRAGYALVDGASKDLERVLLNLFSSKVGYLYLIDECTGVPIVPSSNDTTSVYPIVIANSEATIQRLLPLMLTGMIMMRGERTMLLLARTMMSGSGETPQRWVSASQDIIACLYSPKHEHQFNKLSQSDELRTFKDELVDFISRITERNAVRFPESTDGSEWQTELYFMKFLFEHCDPRRDFAQLQYSKRKNGMVIWTKVETDILPEAVTTESAQSDNLEFYCSDDESSSNDTQEPNQPTETPVEFIEQGNRDDVSSVGESDEEYHSGIEFGSVSGYSAGPSEVDVGESNLLDDLLSENYVTVGEPSRSTTMRQESLETDSAKNTRHNHLTREAFPDWQVESPATAYRDDASSGASSIFTLDDAMPLKEVLRQQEKMLEEIRARLASLDFSNGALTNESKPMLSHVINKLSLYDASAVRLGSDQDDLSSAGGEDDIRTLMARLYNLEERLLDREIDLQQLKLDLHSFELQAVNAVQAIPTRTIAVRRGRQY